MEGQGRSEIEALRVLTVRLLGLLDTAPEERFDRITRLATRIFDVPVALISLVEDDPQGVKAGGSTGINEGRVDFSFCGNAVLEDETIIVHDTLLDLRFKDNPLVTGPAQLRFYAGRPLKVSNGSRVGTLCLIDRRPHELDAYELELLNDLAKIVEQEMGVDQFGTMDELTMLSNRRGFRAIGQHSVNICKRNGRSASLFFFDLNHFKKVNDDHGHAEGDKALIGFAGALRTAFRNSDVIGRMGGDEFAVLLTGANEFDASLALRRLNEIVREINAQGDRGYSIRYSVGATALDHERHVSIDDMTRDADAIMYEHKKQSAQLDLANGALPV